MSLLKPIGCASHEVTYQNAHERRISPPEGFMKKDVVRQKKVQGRC